MRYVIVGDGPAGLSAAEAILELDPAARPVVVSEEDRPPYCRPLISYWLSGETPADLFPLPTDSPRRGRASAPAGGPPAWNPPPAVLTARRRHGPPLRPAPPGDRGGLQDPRHPRRGGARRLRLPHLGRRRGHGQRDPRRGAPRAGARRRARRRQGRPRPGRAGGGDAPLHRLRPAALPGGGRGDGRAGLEALEEEGIRVRPGTRRRPWSAKAGA